MLNVLTYDDCYQVIRTNSSFITSAIFYFTKDYETDDILDSHWGELALDVGGRTYFYQDFPVTRFLALVNAESLGEFYNEFIKPKYDCMNE